MTANGGNNGVVPSGKPGIAYLGPPSSYTHQATVDNFDAKEYDLQPRGSIVDVFHAVQEKSVRYGVVPFENSSNGAVIQTLDIFGDKTGHYNNLEVVGEAYIEVHHCLLGFASASDDGEIESGEATPTTKVPLPTKPKAKPKKRVQHIRKVYSHPQAFGQCEAFLSAHLKGAERQEVSSTSRAAQIVAEDPERMSAAISSRMAAEVHGLEILASGIEDRPDNETRFLVLRLAEPEKDNEPMEELKLAGLSLGEDQAAEPKHWKTFISFTIDHFKPGSLSRVLDSFTTFGLNLMSINSRPSRTKPWHYTFFVEFEGRKGQEAVDKTLDQIKQVTEEWRWHGSWRKRGGL